MSTTLPPSLRFPLPPGLGLELGGPAPGGGRVVLAPLAGSPAEAAGIQRGDTLLTIGGWLIGCGGVCVSSKAAECLD